MHNNPPNNGGIVHFNTEADLLLFWRRLIIFEFEPTSDLNDDIPPFRIPDLNNNEIAPIRVIPDFDDDEMPPLEDDVIPDFVDDMPINHVYCASEIVDISTSCLD